VVADQPEPGEEQEHAEWWITKYARRLPGPPGNGPLRKTSTADGNLPWLPDTERLGRSVRSPKVVVRFNVPAGVIMADPTPERAGRQP